MFGGASESDDEDGAIATLDSQGRIWGTSEIGLDFTTRSCDFALESSALSGAWP